MNERGEEEEELTGGRHLESVPGGPPGILSSTLPTRSLGPLVEAFPSSSHRAENVRSWKEQKTLPMSLL
jgi:hypothetical protein